MWEKSLCKLKPFTRVQLHATPASRCSDLKAIKFNFYNIVKSTATWWDHIEYRSKLRLTPIKLKLPISHFTILQQLHFKSLPIFSNIFEHVTAQQLKTVNASQPPWVGIKIRVWNRKWNDPSGQAHQQWTSGGARWIASINIEHVDRIWCIFRDLASPQTRLNATF